MRFGSTFQDEVVEKRASTLPQLSRLITRSMVTGPTSWEKSGTLSGAHGMTGWWSLGSPKHIHCRPTLKHSQMLTVQTLMSFEWEGVTITICRNLNDMHICTQINYQYVVSTVFLAMLCTHSNAFCIYSVAVLFITNHFVFIVEPHVFIVCFIVSKSSSLSHRKTCTHVHAHTHTHIKVCGILSCTHHVHSVLKGLLSVKPFLHSPKSEVGEVKQFTFIVFGGCPHRNVKVAFQHKLTCTRQEKQNSNYHFSLFNCCLSVVL